MIDLSVAIRDYFEMEYPDFLEDCDTYDENPGNYPAPDELWYESLRVLFRNKVVDSLGFCNKTLQECLDLYGNLDLETYPILYSNGYKELPKLKLRTILSFKQKFSFNINNYIIDEI